MNEFIALDFETGTRAPESAVSIGLVKYRDYRPIASYYSLIRPPELFILPEFTNIHGLTVDSVQDAPAFDAVWETGLRAFLGNTPLSAHNASFDMGVLAAVLAHYAIPLPALRYFCTLKLARKTWPGLRSHSLPNLAKEYGIMYESHNALADADTCARITALAARAFSGAEGAENPGEREKPLSLSALLKKAGLKLEKFPRA